MNTNFTPYEIAGILESTATNFMNEEGVPMGKTIYAGILQSKYFAETMCVLLRMKTKFEDDDEVNNFIKECTPYYFVSIDQIGEKEANRLYGKFINLFNKDDKKNR